MRYDQWEEIETVRAIGPCCLHVRLIHELEMWFCQGEDCCERFATKRGIEDHMDVTHRGEAMGLIDESFLDFQGLRS